MYRKISALTLFALWGCFLGFPPSSYCLATSYPSLPSALETTLGKRISSSINNNFGSSFIHVAKALLALSSFPRSAACERKHIPLIFQQQSVQQEMEPQEVEDAIARSREAHLRQVNMRKTPSQRTPQMMAWLNTADRIEEGRREDRHRTWGFVIYRCDYESDDDWKILIDRLNYWISDYLKFYNGLDMLDSLEIAVLEDRSTLEGASKDFVRERFTQWAAEAPQREQGTGPGLSQRYHFCLQVDSAALKSIVYDSPPPSDYDGDRLGFVNLIWKDWEPEEEEIDPEDLPEEYRREDKFPPIEGSTLEDVGWMKVSCRSLVSFYGLLRDPNTWYTEYRRPPEIARD